MTQHAKTYLTLFRSIEKTFTERSIDVERFVKAFERSAKAFEHSVKAFELFCKTFDENMWNLLIIQGKAFSYREGFSYTIRTSLISLISILKKSWPYEILHRSKMRKLLISEL